MVLRWVVTPHRSFSKSVSTEVREPLALPLPSNLPLNLPLPLLSLNARSREPDSADRSLARKLADVRSALEARLTDERFVVQRKAARFTLPSGGSTHAGALASVRCRPIAREPRSADIVGARLVFGRERPADRAARWAIGARAMESDCAFAFDEVAIDESADRAVGERARLADLLVAE